MKLTKKSETLALCWMTQTSSAYLQSGLTRLLLGMCSSVDPRIPWGNSSIPSASSSPLRRLGSRAPALLAAGTVLHTLAVAVELCGIAAALAGERIGGYTGRSARPASPRPSRFRRFGNCYWGRPGCWSQAWMARHSWPLVTSARAKWCAWRRRWLGSRINRHGSTSARAAAPSPRRAPVGGRARAVASR